MSGVKRYDIYMHSDEIQFLRECQDGDYVRWNDYDQLRDRLLALEDALKEAGPALEAGAVALVNASFAIVRNPEYSPKCEKRAAQLRALAALGGDT